MESRGFLQRIFSFLTAENETSIANEKLHEKVTKLETPEPFGKKYNIEVVEPQSIEESKAIADRMISESTLILNLQSLTDEQAKEMLYFLSGVSHALGGNIEKISKASIFLYTPKHVKTKWKEATPISEPKLRPVTASDLKD